MGNCMHTEPNYQFAPSKISSRNGSVIDDGRQINLLSRLETVEGSLFLSRSIMVRNFLHIQGEIDKLITKQKRAEAAFALKRVKLFEALLQKVEEQMEALRVAMDYAQANKKKNQSLKILSITYLLVEDIDEVNKLEDALHGTAGDEETMAKLNALFEKYEINDDEVNEEVNNMDPPFHGIELVESFCVLKSSIPNFKSSNELPQMILPRFSSSNSLAIQNCASDSNNLPRLDSNKEINMPIVIGS